MRVDIKKFLCVGPDSQRDLFFREAQQAGVIEFIDAKATHSTEWPSELQEMKMAYHAIHTDDSMEQRPFGKDWTACLLTQRILDSLKDEEQCIEELRHLKLEIARVEPFGVFSKHLIEEIESQSNHIAQYFFSNQVTPQEVEKIPNLLHVNSKYGLDYYLSFNTEKVDYEGLIEMNIPLPLGVLQKKYVFVKDKLKKIRNEVKELGHYSQALLDILIEEVNEHNLYLNKDFVSLECNEKLFYVEAWVSKSQMKEFQQLLGALHVQGEEISIEKEDRPPTFLKNKGVSRMGQDLVEIYDIPSHEDKDTSRWLLWWFAFFFAYIVADAGYGLVIFIFALFFYIKFPKAKGGVRRFFHLCTLLSVFCMIWGTLISSFFGIDIGVKSPIRDVSIVQMLCDKKANYLIETKNENYKEWLERFPKVASATTPIQFYEATKFETAEGVALVSLDKFTNSVLLEFSLIIGVLHLILSFLRRAKEHIAGFGWIIFMIGCYLVFPTTLKADSMLYYVLGLVPTVAAGWGVKILFIGLAFALIVAILQHKKGGMTEIMNLIQVFADTLSYLRLFALALAGGMMSSTFNMLGAETGWFFGFFIILIGQTVNFTLSVVGGIIHGLRLNFLEWYHYCFDGGGRLFNPLKLLKRS